MNELYFQISISKEKKCLTIDTREVNDLGPGKFRTSADNGEVKLVILIETKATLISIFFNKRAFRQDNPSDFLLLNQILIVLS